MFKYILAWVFVGLGIASVGCKDSETSSSVANAADMTVRSDMGPEQPSVVVMKRVIQDGFVLMASVNWDVAQWGHALQILIVQSGAFCEPLVRCSDANACADGVCDCEGICRPMPEEPCSTDLQCDVADYCDTCVGGCAARSEQCEPCTSDSQCASNARCRTPSGGILASTPGVTVQGVCMRQCQGSCDLLGPGFECVPSGDVSVCAPESGMCGSLLTCSLDSTVPRTNFAMTVGVVRLVVLRTLSVLPVHCVKLADVYRLAMMGIHAKRRWFAIRVGV